MELDEFPWLQPDPEPRPTLALKNVFLHVTKACNLSCKYCYFSARKPLPDEMATDEFAPLWPEIVALGPRKVIFTGGEPLLRRDLFELLTALRDVDPLHRVVRCLNTNGHLIRPSLAASLSGLVDEVRVSVDGPRECNDALRGSGNFDTAMQALEILSASGFEPKVLVTITTFNVFNLEELLCQLFQMRLVRVNLNGFRAIGRGQGHPEWRANPSLVRDAIDRARNRCGVEPLPRVALLHSTPQHNCGVGQFLNVMPNGDVFPCHVLTDPRFRLGNVRDQSLLQICSAHGLLSQLASLDLPRLAGADGRLNGLLDPTVCMGNVYRDTANSKVWADNLPALPPMES